MPIPILVQTISNLDLLGVTMKEWNGKMTYKTEANLKMQKEAEEKKQEENAEMVSTPSAPAFYKLDPSPSSYVIAVEGKFILVSMKLFQKFSWSVSLVRSKKLHTISFKIPS